LESVFLIDKFLTRKWCFVNFCFYQNTIFISEITFLFNGFAIFHFFGGFIFGCFIGITALLVVLDGDG
jgi:hypothetical protein